MRFNLKYTMYIAPAQHQNFENNFKHSVKNVVYLLHNIPVETDHFSVKVQKKITTSNNLCMITGICPPQGYYKCTCSSEVLKAIEESFFV